MPKRIDFAVITGFIPEGARVLDLGCGDGGLLAQLIAEKQVSAEGVDIAADGIERCVARGIPVHHGNIDEGLKDYAAHSFDYVILSQTLQVTRDPLLVLDEMLRVGDKAIVSILNFGHIVMRLQLLFGRMPVTKTFPYQWYNTPNIRHTTIRDFRRFLEDNGFAVQQEVDLLDTDRTTTRLFSNLRARLAIFVLTKR